MNKLSEYDEAVRRATFLSQSPDRSPEATAKADEAWGEALRLRRYIALCIDEYEAIRAERRKP